MGAAWRDWAVWLLACLLSTALLAADLSAPPSLQAQALPGTGGPGGPIADWPHWRGPLGSGQSPANSGYDQGAWPPGEAAWLARVGEGASAPLIVGETVYTMGWESGQDQVVALNLLTGERRWRVDYEARRHPRRGTGDQEYYAGPSAAPAYDPATGYLYTLNTDGELRCWATKEQGRLVWQLNLYERYAMGQRPAVQRSGQRDYGYTAAPLLLGGELLVEAGGQAGLLVALDPASGKQLWASVAKGLAGHSGGLTPLKVGEQACVAVLAHAALVIIKVSGPERGQTLHEYPYETHFANSMVLPLAHGSSLLLSSGFNHNQTIRLDVSARELTRRWVSKEVVGVHPPVLHEGSLYLSGKRLACLDWETGTTRWTRPLGGPAGSLAVTGDARLLVFANKGDLYLLEGAGRSPTAAKVLAEKRNLFKREAWPHLALASGWLVLKDRAGNLAGYRLTPGTTPPPTASDGPNPAPVPPPATPPASALEITKLARPPDGVMARWRQGQGAKLSVPGEAAAQLTLDGEARLAANGVLMLAGGSVRLPEATAAALLAACQQSHELGLELAFKAAPGKQVGPARLLSFSADPYHRNFTVGQAEQKLILRLRTPRSGVNGLPDLALAAVKADTWQHLQVSYREGQVLAWLDGERVLERAAFGGDFSTWEAMPLLLGNEAKEARPWAGQIATFCLMAKALDDATAKARFAAWRQALPAE